MKKTIIGIISILILSLLLTACGAPAESPSDVAESQAQETAGEFQKEPSAEEQSGGQQSAEQDISLNGNAVASQETKKEDQASLLVQENPVVDNLDSQKKPEKENNETYGKEEDKQSTASKVAQQQEKEEKAPIEQEVPEFYSGTALRNWLLSENSTDKFAEERNDYLSVMGSKNQVVYYQPTLGDGNDLLQLEKVKITPTMHYYYQFTDETYGDLKFRISCYMNDIQKDFYLEMKNNALNNVDGNTLVNIHGYDVIHYDNQHGGTVFCWSQFGGYFLAFLEGDNHNDKVQDILPYLKLEKVTLRTDTVTQ